MTVSVLVSVAGDDENRVDSFVRALAGLEAADLAVHVLHVYGDEDREKIQSMYDIDPRDPNDLAAAAEHNSAVKALVDALDDRDVENTIHGALGEAGPKILETAEDLDVDYVLVGGRKRTPAGKALFGSTAQEVLLNAPCPVIYTGPMIEDA